MFLIRTITLGEVICSRRSHITIIESHKISKLNHILDAYYIEIIANSS
jgi:hypothetical protein